MNGCGHDSGGEVLCPYSGFELQLSVSTYVLGRKIRKSDGGVLTTYIITFRKTDELSR